MYVVPDQLDHHMQQLLRAVHPPDGIGGHYRDGQVPGTEGEGCPLPAPAALPFQRVAARLRSTRGQWSVRASVEAGGATMQRLRVFFFKKYFLFSTLTLQKNFLFES